MKTQKTKIEGLLIIEPQIFRDERGFFLETYNQEKYKEAGIEHNFVQDNLSKSTRGVLRGLHYQINPHAQGKLVQVIQGAVLDVAVDIRSGSPSFGQHVSVELNEKNKKQFWIPPGFAHGFISLAEDTIFSYKCTNLYIPESERGIMWNDPDLNIDWKTKDPTISEKDRSNKLFKDVRKDPAYVNERIQ